jgi:hypothetical protein
MCAHDELELSIKISSIKIEGEDSSFDEER